MTTVFISSDIVEPQHLSGDRRVEKEMQNQAEEKLLKAFRKMKKEDQDSLLVLAVLSAEEAEEEKVPLRLVVCESNVVRSGYLFGGAR
jgi:glutathionylspermidine synthase